MAYYLDTSAFLKLVTTEPETSALHSWVQQEDPTLFSSDLLRTKALSAARRYSVEAHRLARRRLEALTFLSLTTDICERAADLDPAILRSLDALHLASALSVAEELEGIVTYDERLRTAADLHGVAVVAPSVE
jgi:predicted nucleic acid-binding protein